MAISYENYRIGYDYHTHTIYSHGKGTIEDNVEAADRIGLSGIAIADHGPGHLFFGIDRDKVPEMRRIIERLRGQYENLDIFLSVEANIIHGGNGLDITKAERSQYDFIIAGYHFGVRRGYCVRNYTYDKNFPFPGKKGLLVKNTDMVVRALYENSIKILTHPGDKGPFDIAEIAKACAATGTLMEISSHHGNLTVEEIRLAAKEDVSFIISSDAHIPERVGRCDRGIRRALVSGLDLSRIVNLRKCQGGTIL